MATKTTNPPVPAPGPRWRQLVWLLVRLAVVVGVFVFIFRTTDVDFGELRQEAARIRWGYVLLGLAVWLGATYIASFRWKLLLGAVGVRVSAGVLFAYNLVGVFYAQFLPGLVGGELAKGYYLARQQDEKIKLMSSALVDRLLGIAVNGIFGVLTLIASPLILATFSLDSAQLVWVLVGAVAAMGAAYGMVFVVERFERWLPGPLQKLFEPVKLYARHPVALGAATVASLGYFLVWALALYALAAAMNLTHLGYLTFVMVLVVLNVAQFLPLSINGAGIREGAIVALLTAYNVPDAQALVYALLIPLCNIVLAALGGVMVLVDYRPGHVSPPEMAPPEPNA